MFSLTGRLHDKFDTVQISEKYSKREFIIEITDGHYPEHIKFQFVMDKTFLLEPFNIGDKVVVDFQLRGRGFNKSGHVLYFTNLEAQSLKPA